MPRNLVSYAIAPLLSISLLAAQTPQITGPGGSTAAVQPLESPQSSKKDHILQDGTPVKLQLSRTLSSADAKPGEEIPFEVVDDIDIDGVTVLHRGASATGVVTAAEAKKRMGRAGKLNFTITSVQLADKERASLRAINDSSGDSRVKGMTALMVSGVPMVAAPFLLLIKGGDTSIPKGTQITAFVDGDMHLDMSKFPGPAESRASSVVQISLAIESTPDGAEIEVDGASVGSTPATIGFDPGTHRIRIKKKGFADWSQSVEVASGTGPVKAVLEAIREP